VNHVHLKNFAGEVVFLDRIETNIYLIENLKELNCRYRIYKIRGLTPDSDDYDKNIQFLIDNLSRKYKCPCQAYKTDEGTFIAQPEGFEELPKTFNLVRVSVKIEKTEGLHELKFDALNSLTSKLAIRFLQFSLQKPLYDSPNLWQPRAGFPFYSNIPDREFRKLSLDVDMYNGFIFRVVLLSKGRIGICVDTSCKYISRNYLPTKISRDDFNKKYKGLNCIYEYGTRWYEFKIEGLNDLNISEVDISGETLYNHVIKIGKGRSQNILSLPRDCSVITYRNSWNDLRNVPSGLCKLTFKTNHPSVKRIHAKTIRPPYVRRNEIKFVIDRYFRDLKFGSNEIKLSNKPISIDEEKFEIPDLEFGNNKILSVRKTENAIHTSISEFGRKKRELLYDKDAGLYSKNHFDPQYIILPKSVYESFGKKFIEDIKQEVQSLYPIEEINYSPIVLHYDDSVQKSIYKIGREIIKAIEENELQSGFGLVMIPRIPSTLSRNEDELANLVNRELRKRDIFVSIIHDETPKESYEFVPTEGGVRYWEQTTDYKKRGKFKGYLKNVVLNKILLLNSHWPFVLKTPLNADMTIGIDVKNHTAGFVIVYKNGADIRFISSESEQKEELLKSHISQKIEEIISNEQKLFSKNVKKIIIQRQGRLFSSEKSGILDALEKLARRKIIPDDYECTFVEIKKTAMMPFRMFKVRIDISSQNEIVYNPDFGSHAPVSEDDAFICTTGFPFKHFGTTVPLHVVKIEGPMPFRDLMEDIFYLSNLTWTKVDDCSRDPLTIKIADIRLREIAGEYSEDALEYKEERGDNIE
jgi:hypothetical protein